MREGLRAIENCVEVISIRMSENAARFRSAPLFSADMARIPFGLRR